MLTEARERAVERQGLESGADAYISKSAEQELIILRIKALLRRRSSPIGDAQEERQSPSFGAFRRACILDRGRQPHPQHLSPEHADPRGLCGDGERQNTAEALRLVRSPDATWDCVLVNLLSPSFDGIELCRQLNLYRGLAPAARARTPRPSPSSASATRRVATCSHAPSPQASTTSFPRRIEADVMRVRIRALVRRKLMQDENWRIEAELRERELALARARAEAASARGAAPRPIASSRRPTTS